MWRAAAGRAGAERQVDGSGRKLGAAVTTCGPEGSGAPQQVGRTGILEVKGQERLQGPPWLEVPNPAKQLSVREGPKVSCAFGAGEATGDFSKWCALISSVPSSDPCPVWRHCGGGSEKVRVKVGGHHGYLQQPSL